MVVVGGRGLNGKALGEWHKTQRHGTRRIHIIMVVRNNHELTRCSQLGRTAGIIHGITWHMQNQGIEGLAEPNRRNASTNAKPGITERRSAVERHVGEQGG